MKKNKIISNLYEYYTVTKCLVMKPILFSHSLKQMFSTKTVSVAESLDLSISWLLMSQEKSPDQGYSRGYYFSKNWDSSYIETTGYIITTMLSYGEKYERLDCIDSALRAGKWLLSKQLNSGAFPDIDKGNPLAFDTGQVLYGLNSLATSKYVSDADKNLYLNAAERAAEWLCQSMDEDGSWTTVGFNNMAHTYYSRVAYALARTGYILERDDFKCNAKKNIDWVIGSQKKNGFYAHLNMVEGIDPTLHPISYVLEGLIEYYEMTNDDYVLDSILLNAHHLKEINLERDIILGSQYNDSFECTNNQKCMTGLAQWAGVCLKLYKITSDEGFLSCARKTIYFLNAKQFKTGLYTKGAFSGSLPFWGVYSPFSWNNWPVKFYVDTLMMYSEYELDYKLESMNWTKDCFSFHLSTVMSRFSYVSELIYSYLKETLSKEQRVLDLGCGEGKYVRRLNDLGYNVTGIDPCFFNEDYNIVSGDCYTIPFESDAIDVIFTSETLQHVKYLDSALHEASRCLKADGELIIIDRDPFSVYGLLKPIKEIKNRWMYPAFSPFKEQWYSKKRWEKGLTKAGFNIVEYKVITNKSEEKFAWFSKYHIIRAKKSCVTIP